MLSSNLKEQIGGLVKELTAPQMIASLPCEILMSVFEY